MKPNLRPVTTVTVVAGYYLQIKKRRKRNE